MAANPALSHFFIVSVFGDANIFLGIHFCLLMREFVIVFYGRLKMLFAFSEAMI